MAKKRETMTNCLDNFANFDESKTAGCSSLTEQQICRGEGDDEEVGGSPQFVGDSDSRDDQDVAEGDDQADQAQGDQGTDHLEK